MLDILSRRADGYHNVYSIMQKVSLSDFVSIEIVNADTTSISLNITGGDSLPLDESNLAYRAAKVYLDEISDCYTVAISIDKRIPVAAGMAGGSADAAAVLYLLNEAFDYLLSKEKMMDLALSLGSDVPFCLFGRCAICQSRGEEMQEISLPELNLVIAISDERVSTAGAYKMLDESYSDFDGTISTGGKDFINLYNFHGKMEDYSDIRLFNIFESVILPMCPKTAEIKNKMLSHGASDALMSGSGPSVFGIFPDENSARAVVEILKDCGYSAEYCKTV